MIWLEGAAAAIVLGFLVVVAVLFLAAYAMSKDDPYR